MTVGLKTCPFIPGLMKIHEGWRKTLETDEDLLHTHTGLKRDQMWGKAVGVRVVMHASS